MAHIKMPDRNRVADRKMAKLQQQLHNMEQQMEEQAELRRKAEQLQSMETLRMQQAVERANSSNMVLQDEIERLYNSPSPSTSKILEEVMTLRTKEFQKSQAKKAATIKNLAMERQKIMEARNRLREKNDVFRSVPSPIGNETGSPQVMTPAYRSVHSSDSHVQRVVDDMPNAVDRIWNLRESLHHDYLKMKRPYKGELGVESYEAWQMPDYYVVRKLVDDFVDDFIVKHIPSDYSVFERSMKLEMMVQKDRNWHQTSTALAERRAVKLAAEEIMLEVTSKMTKEIAGEGIHQDVMFKRISSNMFMKEAEIQATGKPDGRDPNDKAYDLVSRSFDSLQKNRDHHKKGVWGHSQVMSHPEVPAPQPLQRDPGPPPPSPKNKKGKKIPEPPKTKTPSHVVKQKSADGHRSFSEPLDADVILISYDHLHPENLKVMEPVKVDEQKEKNRKLWERIYRKKELAYWSNLKPFVFSMNIPKRCQGVSTISPSPDHMMLAVGTVIGDVIVYNTQVEPFAPLRVAIAGVNKGQVMHIAWSVDSSRLLAIRRQEKDARSVHVWETSGSPANNDVLQSFGFSTADNKDQPFSLSPVHVWDTKAGDFTLTEGSLAEQGSTKTAHLPLVAGFFPSLTFLTTQNHVCTASSGGEIMKFDLTPKKYEDDDKKPTVIFKSQYSNEENKANITKQDLLAQLLRQHEHPIICMGFVGNIGKMVTVDNQGFINIWKLDKDSSLYERRDHLTGFDWYFPEGKYKLNLSKTMYSPSNTGKTRVVFTDRRRSKTTTQAEIAAERRKVQRTLDRMQLGDPWHVSSDTPGLDTSIYIPPGVVTASGALFNIVVRHRKTQQLSTFMTRMYTPVKVRCLRILSVKQSPSGNDMVFVLLFPEFPPKASHLMVIVLHLPTMKLRNFRQDINLSKEEYKDIQETKISSADISQVYGPTGADYLFMTLNGRISCMSLNTGSTVLHVDNVSRPKDPTFKGLMIDEKQFNLSKFHQIGCLGNMGSMYGVIYDKSSVLVKVLRLDDGNDHEDSRATWKSYQKWHGFKLTPSELRINPVNWVLSDMKHKEVEMASMFLSLLHDQLGTSADHSKQDKIDGYLAAEAKMSDQALLRDL
ncbi:uncharacterized protein LOC101860420 isoform X1 [Aplysia californica]|uniref:Uncharacterized protein LOC101860420 isoform X1 n=1 Tax=Aplysia californica TaxID=6500 RepID=A0ABM1A3J6_APLCA|nr:uncharacterized protein LOC101860420 isoform X1 [Aplysia californica]